MIRPTGKALCYAVACNAQLLAVRLSAIHMYMNVGRQPRLPTEAGQNLCMQLVRQSKATVG